MWGMMDTYGNSDPDKTKNEGRDSLEIKILLEERQLGNMQRDFKNRFIHDLNIGIFKEFQ